MMSYVAERKTSQKSIAQCVDGHIAVRMCHKTAVRIYFYAAEPHRQALGNLVSNAVKFTERGRVDVEAGGGRLASGVFLLRLDVRDSGPGLEPGEERTVFESFCRGSAAGGKPGTGLGLNIVRTIARRMGAGMKIVVGDK